MRHYFNNTWDYTQLSFMLMQNCLVDSKIITEIKTGNWNRNGPIKFKS